MSDIRQGEGWWLASDGRWYPPEQRVEVPPPPPAPTPAPRAVRVPPPLQPSDSPARPGWNPTQPPAPAWGPPATLTPLPTQPGGARGPLAAQSGGTRAPWWQRRWVLVTGCLVAVFVALSATAGSQDTAGTGSTTAAGPSSDDTNGETPGAPSTAAPSTAAPSTAAPITASTSPPTTEAPAAHGFGSGIQLVGEDIEPGLYVARDPGFCYWERLSGVSGDFEDILANDNVTGAQAIVDISQGDVAFDSSGCGSWQPVDSAPLEPLDSFGDGVWLVGTQIAPGTWEMNGGGLCYWQRSSGFAGDFDDILANDNVEDRAIVEIAPGDAGFVSNGCGTWTRRP